MIRRWLVRSKENSEEYRKISYRDHLLPLGLTDPCRRSPMTVAYLMSEMFTAGAKMPKGVRGSCSWRVLYWGYITVK